MKLGMIGGQLRLRGGGPMKRQVARAPGAATGANACRRGGNEGLVSGRSELVGGLKLYYFGIPACFYISSFLLWWCSAYCRLVAQTLRSHAYISTFGRGWKKIEDFVGTKTVIQIRSHAQKYFQKVQASGMMANLPPPRPKRKADHPLQQKTSYGVVPMQASKICSSASSCLLPACSPWDDRSMQPMLLNYSSADAIYTPDYFPVLPEVKGDTGVAGVGTLDYQNNGWTGSSSRPWQTYEVPMLADSHASYPAIPNFTEVYNFIASMFDPFVKCPLAHFLRKLKEMDPITAKTVLLLVKNLTINMSSPDFESLGMWLSTYDGNTKTSRMNNTPAAAADAHQIHSMSSQEIYCLPPPP